ncbi:MAG: hypothetical protein ACUVTR_04025 [Dehalococcoidia bacterium]
MPTSRRLAVREDRGSQFKAHRFREAACLRNVTLEYAAVKCLEDNRYIKSFIRSYDTEKLYRHEYCDFAEAMTRLKPGVHAIAGAGCATL